jgi:ketosteroid isomerase-like protein
MSVSTSRRDQTQLLYEAFVSGGFERLEEHLHPRVEFVNPADAVEPGTRIGPGPFIGAVRRLHDMFDYDGFELVDFVERGGSAVAVVRFLARGRGSDAPVDATFAHLMKWDEGKLTRLEWFRSADEAIAALD